MQVSRSLNPTAAQALEAIYQHRLLTTSQLRELLAPESPPRRLQKMLAELAQRGLAAAVLASRSATPGRGERVWHLTRLGAEVVEAVPNRAESRRRLLTPEMAGGQLQAHTLAVNDTGLAFLRAARSRGHDFGPFSWRHEVAHDLGRGSRRSPDLLVADALLRYWLSAGGRAALHYRFLELDRATRPVDDLAAKLAGYAQLHRRWLQRSALEAHPSEELPAWSQLYRAFPKVMVVLANPRRANLRRRLETVIGLCRAEPALHEGEGVAISFALFDDLAAWGPFAPVFRRLEDDRPVNWLGRQAVHPRARAETEVRPK